MHLILIALLLLALPASAADISASSWSEIDANNNASPPAGWPAGMAPNQVEPTARAMMGGIKRWYDHANATVTSGGSANAQTLTYSVAPAALVSGDVYRFKVGFANTGATTLNINGLGAKAVQVAGVALAGGELALNSMVEVIYDGTQFQLSQLYIPTNVLIRGGAITGLSTIGTTYMSIPNQASVHEGVGGEATFSQHVTINGDHVWLKSGDWALYAQSTVSGTPVAGQIQGQDWTINGVVYQIRYTTIVGDDLNAVAMGICAATVAHPGLTAALDAYHGTDGKGYVAYQTGCANQVFGPTMKFNFPWAVSGNSVTAVSSAGVTVGPTVSALAGSGTPKMDGGPFLVVQRDFPSGYTVGTGDQGPIIAFQDSEGATLNQQIGAIGFDKPSAAAWQMYFNVRNGGSGSTTRMSLADNLTMHGSQIVFSAVDSNNNFAHQPCGIEKNAGGMLQLNLCSGGLFINNSLNSATVLQILDNGVATYNGSFSVTGPITSGQLLTSGHVTGGGTAASVGSGFGDCGTSPELVGNDTVGRVTVGSGTNGNKCTITFAAPYATNAPVCTVANETSVNRPVYPIGTTTATLTITGSASLVAGDKLIYRCDGIQ